MIFFIIDFWNFNWNCILNIKSVAMSVKSEAPYRIYQTRVEVVVGS